jgi:aminoglycoside phosphotransferase (APT) family kinase protein
VDEVALAVSGSGTRPSKATRRGAVVHRQAGPWTPAVLALLRHFERVGFDGAPRVVGSGLASDGRETVTYIEGSSPQPHAWPGDAVAEIGHLLRAAHDATIGFAAPAGCEWQPWFGRDLPGARPVIGHCDLGPWNVIARDGRPVAFVDWEFAGPVDALWDLAQTAWLNAQLHDDDVAVLANLPEPAERARQLGLLLDGYRLEPADRAGFVDRMIEIAVHSARADAVDAGVSRDTATTTDASGYPFLWGIAWRVRSASWMLRNRAMLERAVSG